MDTTGNAVDEEAPGRVCTSFTAGDGYGTIGTQEPELSAFRR